MLQNVSIWPLKGIRNGDPCSSLTSSSVCDYCLYVQEKSDLQILRSLAWLQSKWFPYRWCLCFLSPEMCCPSLWSCRMLLLKLQHTGSWSQSHTWDKVTVRAASSLCTLHCCTWLFVKKDFLFSWRTINCQLKETDHVTLTLDCNRKSKKCFHDRLFFSIDTFEKPPDGA